jgi:hypothetical protein
MDKNLCKDKILSWMEKGKIEVLFLSYTEKQYRKFEKLNKILSSNLVWLQKILVFVFHF